VTGDTVVQMTAVTLTYRRRGRDPVHALRDVDLEVAAGERLAVVGRSGAGKSTLARVLLGMEQPTAGTVRVLGKDVAGLRGRRLRDLRQRMHLVFQDPYDSLHPGMAVEQAVAEPLAISGVARGQRRARVVRALEEVGLTPAETFLPRVPSSLSGGQRQRVAMARAVVAEPELVIADEPTSMLDASLRTTVIDLLLALQRDHGTALVFITHDLAVARHVADRVAVVDDGQLVEHGPVQQLLAAPAHPASRLLVDAVRALHGTRPPADPHPDDDGAHHDG